MPDHEILKGVEIKAYSLIKSDEFRLALASIDSLSFGKLPVEYKQNEKNR